MRETLQKHGFEPQPASEFNAREEGCWLLTPDQFAGMECRVVVRVGGYNYGDANATCRCTSYLIHVTNDTNLGTYSRQKWALQYINPYQAGTRKHREVQNKIDGKFNVYIGSRLPGHIVCSVYIVRLNRLTYFT